MNEDGQRIEKDELTESIDRSVIAVPLQEKMRQQPTQRAPRVVSVPERMPSQRIDVVIDLNYNFALGVEDARKKVEWILAYLAFLVTEADVAEGRRGPSPKAGATRRGSGQFVFARLAPSEIEMLVAIDRSSVENAVPQDAKKAFGKRLAKRYFASRAIHRIWPDFEMKGLEGA